MKKITTIVIVLALLLALLAGCAPKQKPGVNGETEVDRGIVKVGLGQKIMIENSKDLEENAYAKTDNLMIAAGFDKEGRVVTVSIDTILTTIIFDKELQIINDFTQPQKTIKEQSGQGDVNKEWAVKAEALEKWMIGKTAKQIKELIESNDKELAAIVVINKETGFQDVLEEAYNNAFEVKGVEKVGLGQYTTIAKSKSMGINADKSERLPFGQTDTIMAAIALDSKGRIVKTIFDDAQTKVMLDKEGKIISDKKAEYKTKGELKEEYKPEEIITVKKEWYQQMEALADWTKGKNLKEVAAIKLKEQDANHPAVPDEEQLKGDISISIEGFLAALQKAADNAK